ncbi:MAG: DUF2029 domain-containing protein [Candidatus Eremiobacteraeota bacterium]|nr:DUF2029 domain-containing protein [Candidatus Eremiobacteraeota bacterium]
MRRFWFWVAAMAVLVVLGSFCVRAIAFAMVPDAPIERYGGFHVGLSLPIPVVQVAPHWHAIIALWCMLAALAVCGWQAARSVATQHQPSLWPIMLGYALVAGVFTFFSVTLSIDSYYYTAFARLFGVYGIDPYVLVSPIRVADPILTKEYTLLHNPPFPDPYGPGFTLLAGLVGRLEINATLWQQLWTWRLISVASCLGILAALARLLARAPARERVQRLALVAFHPLVLYESGAGGHNDFLMVAAALWSYAIVDELPLIAGLLLGAAISIKYFAAILLPFIAIRAARKNLVAPALIVGLAVVVPVLCFHPFTFGHTGQTTLAKVGANLSMSLTWLVSLPLLMFKASAAGAAQPWLDTALRCIQFAVGAAFLAITLVAAIAYARRAKSALILRCVTALLWSLPALHPWYGIWLAPGAAVRSAWAPYAWWFCALMLLIYAHEAVLPTPVNHTIFIAIAVVVLAVPIIIARRATQGLMLPQAPQAAAEPQEGAQA